MTNNLTPPADLRAGTPAAIELATHLSRIMAELMGTPWVAALEFPIWAELQCHRRGFTPVNQIMADLLAPHLPQLDRLQVAARGWIWEIDGAPTWLSEREWLEMCAARVTFHWMRQGTVTNEEIHRRADHRRRARPSPMPTGTPTDPIL